MGNTIRFFEFKQAEWIEAAEQKSSTDGHRCFAYQQADIWKSLGERAKGKFGSNAN